MAAARILISTLLLTGALSACGDQPPGSVPGTGTPAPKPAPAAPTPAPSTTPTKPDALKPAAPAMTPANPTLPIEKVTISGKTFKLELANTDETRYKGLSGRASISADGGMLFVFPARAVMSHGFVMRDCPVPIDIIYLDLAGRIVSMHKMVPEPPRTDAEKVLTPKADQPAFAADNKAYENRLRQYPSRFPSQFVIELAGNTLDTLNLKNGMKIELDLDRLKKAAK
jgi:uncharacterized protein